VLCQSCSVHVYSDNRSWKTDFSGGYHGEALSVTLLEEERQQLESMVSTGKGQQENWCVPYLLLADQAEAVQARQTGDCRCLGCGQ